MNMYSVKFLIFNGIIFVLLPWLIFAVPTSFESNCTDTSSLQMIAAIFRHGHRTPARLYPNDPHINYPWPGGLGALTKKGALEHFNLGQKFRKRYRQLLPEDGQYSQNNVNVRSSHYERCAMSAQSLLAGFMPPLKSENVLGLNWQPVAITTISSPLDNLLAQSQRCKKYDDIYVELNKNPTDDKKEIRAIGKFFTLLSRRTGMNITGCIDVYTVLDALLIQQEYGLAWPKWVTKLTLEKMWKYGLKFYDIIHYTPYMRAVKAGPLITEIVNFMTAKREQNLNPDRNIFLYSGHDTTVLSIVKALNITNQTTAAPDHAASLIFELHKNGNNELHVKLLFYKNSEDNSPTLVNIPGCENPCNLDSFKDAVKDFIIEDYDEFCGNVNWI